MLILDRDLISGVQIGCQRCKSQKREQGIFDRTPERAIRLRQSWQDHFYFHSVPPSPSAEACLRILLTYYEVRGRQSATRLQLTKHQAQATESPVACAYLRELTMQFRQLPVQIR